MWNQFNKLVLLICFQSKYKAFLARTCSRIELENSFISKFKLKETKNGNLVRAYSTELESMLYMNTSPYQVQRIKKRLIIVMK